MNGHLCNTWDTSVVETFHLRGRFLLSNKKSVRGEKFRQWVSSSSTILLYLMQDDGRSDSSLDDRQQEAHV